MAVTASIADRLDQFDWMGSSTTRYERLKSSVTTLNPWKRRLLFLLPLAVILSWAIYAFNPITTPISEYESIDDPSLNAKIPLQQNTEKATETLYATETITAPAVTVTGAAPPAETVFVNNNENKASPYNETKIAFLMETRNTSHMVPLLMHMISVIPDDWKFRFMGSQDSVNFINSSLPIQRYEKMGKLDMVLIPPNVSYKGQQELSETFTNLWFYETVLAPAEWLLVFQTDSIMCANSGKDLNDWLHYDWVGAPWPWAPNGGNGGLSLRRVSSLIKILKEKQRKKGDSELEDLWFSNRLAETDWAKMADKTTESSFSVENSWFDRPMGYHTGWGGSRLPEDVWGTPEKRQKIFEYCPEMKMTMAMKLERECEGHNKRDEEQFWVRAW